MTYGGSVALGPAGVRCRENQFLSVAAGPVARTAGKYPALALQDAVTRTAIRAGRVGSRIPPEAGRVWAFVPASQSGGIDAEAPTPSAGRWTERWAPALNR